MECRCCCMHSIFCKQKHGTYVEDVLRKKIYNKNIHIKFYGAVDIAECLIQTNFSNSLHTLISHSELPSNNIITLEHKNSNCTIYNSGLTIWLSHRIIKQPSDQEKFHLRGI